MTQTRVKWDSHILRGPDLLMVWRYHGILCIHFYFFGLEETLGNDT